MNFGGIKMDFVLEFVANLVYVICFIVMGQLFLGFQRAYCKYEYIVLISLTFITTILWFTVETWLKMVAHMGCVLITLLVYFAEKKKKLVGLYLSGMAILAMFEMMFKIVILGFAKYGKLSLSNSMVNFISCATVGIFIYGVGAYFKSKYPYGFKKMSANYLIVFAIILFLDATILVSLADVVINVLEAERKWIYELLYIGIVVGILVQIVLLINTLITRNIYKENVALAQKYLDNQNEHYLYLEKREVETKKFRHDIKNHLLLLGNLMQNADYDGANQYLDTINDKVSTFGNRISVNNSIADAILNKYLDEADQKGIEIKVAGHFPLACFISAYDICTVLSNLLSNAILAEEQAQGKRVELEIRYTEDEILFLMENDYVHELKMENGTFQSTKKEEAGHGYGLVNVKECVEKNDGTFLIDTENQKFKVMLSMKNRQGEIS